MSILKLSRLAVCALMLALFGLAQEAPKADESASTNITIPSGAALSEGEVIILLQAKVPLDVIQKFVSARGVAFVSTKETSKRILAAGGNVSLVGTINLNQKDELTSFVNDKDKDNKKR